MNKNLDLKVSFVKDGLFLNGRNHMLIEVEPKDLQVKNEVKKERNRDIHNCYMFVVDKSGSMSQNLNNSNIYRSLSFNEYDNNSKIDSVKKTLNHSVDFLNKNDYMGIITFDDMSYLEISPIVIENNEDKLKGIIKNIKCDGMTNISSALFLAHQEILKLYNKVDLKMKYHIILLSDGNANVGIRDVEGLSELTRKIRDNDITITTIGIGNDYDSLIMSNIAKYGLGNFYHINKVSKIEEVFDMEFNDDKYNKIENCEVVLKLPELVIIKDNLNDYEQVNRNGCIQVLLGNFIGKKQIIFEIENFNQSDEIEIEIECNFTYKDKEYTIKKEKVLKIYKDAEEYKNLEESISIIKELITFIKLRDIQNISYSRSSGDTSYINSCNFGSNLALSFCGGDKKPSNSIYENSVNYYGGTGSSKTQGYNDNSSVSSLNSNINATDKEVDRIYNNIFSNCYYTTQTIKDEIEKVVKETNNNVTNMYTSSVDTAKTMYANSFSKSQYKNNI